MAKRTILILGGAQSGPTAAARARETDERARIVLLERGRDVSYAVGGLAYHLSREAGPAASLDRERAEFFHDVYQVEVLTGANVEAIDPRRRRVRVDGKPLAYTTLVHALGAESLLPEVPGLWPAANVCHFRTLGDLERVAGALAQRGRRVAILGGGFFGVELADGLLRRGGVEVTLLERKPRLLGHFSDSFSRLAEQALTEAGAQVIAGARLLEAERRGDAVRTLVLAGGARVPVDLVVVAAGVRPRTELLRQAGARLHADASVQVDARAETSLPGIFACGVCVALPHAVSRRPVWFAQAAEADKSAQVAGENAAGGNARLPAALGSAIVRAGALTLGRTGLDREQATRFARGRLSIVTTHAPARDRFMPGADPVTIDLLLDRRSGRLLGAEVAGRSGADKRLDVLATAIRGRLTVEDLALLDLGYASPFAAARDPVNVAGTVAAKLREGGARGWSAAEVAERLGKIRLVDVRDESDHRAGTLPGAFGVPLADLRRRLREIPAGELVFVSGGGRRGYLAARLARGRGRRGAGFLLGGLDSWAAAGQPLAGAGR